MNKKSLILICGTGSIAKRHAKNLLHLGYKNLIFFRETNNPIPFWIKKFPIFYNISNALKEKPKVTLICNVTSKHLKYALKCAREKSHLFIEKPLSDKSKGLAELKKIVHKNKVKLMVGYMMRFHPLVKRIKKIIQKKQLGKIFYAYSVWSEYLPDWHPKEDYRKSYAGSTVLGGGSTLTLSHEIDLMCWFFGEIKEINTIKNYVSKLKIKSEFATNHQINFQNGVNAQIHLDYLQKPPKRKMHIVGDLKKLSFDYYKNEIIITNRKGKKTFFKAKKFDRNQMFIDEMKSFLKCISQNLKIESNIDNSISIIKSILK